MDAERNTLQPQLLPVADLTAENLAALIRDMDMEPGWYPAGELYGWYLGMAKEADLKPVSQKIFGTRLRELGYRVAARRVAGRHARCWFIPRHAIRSAQS
jgi:hypothetical protein